MNGAATTYPLHQRAPAVARRGRTLAYIRAASLPIWMFTLQLPFWFVVDWRFWREGFDFRSYYFVGFAVCLAAHLALGFGPWIRAPFEIMRTWSGAFMLLFCAIAFITSPLSLRPSTSAMYAAASAGVYILLLLYWQAADYTVVRRMIVLAGVMIFAWQIILCLKLGVTVGFSIGGILRNYTGQAALTGMSCCILSRSRAIRWSSIAAAIFFSLLVNSRGSLVAIGVFLIAYYGAYFGTARSLAYGIIGTVALCAGALVLPHLRHVIVDDVFHVHDEGRGIGSGMTGRTKLNEGGKAVFKKPLFGFGFRVSFVEGGELQAIHSGYLKILVETGFVGAFLILGSVLIETVRRFRIVQRFRTISPGTHPYVDVVETTQLNAAAFATLCTTLALWAIEPLYINLGAVTSLFFWLIMVAPTYITFQDKPRYP